MSASEFKDSNVDWIGKIPSHWELIALKRMCRPTRGQSPRPIDDPKYWDDNGEYGWVRISDVTLSGKYLNQTRDYLTTLGKSKSVALEPGELIISIAATVGVPSITDMKCCIHDGFVHLTGLNMDLDYVYNLLTTPQIFSKFGKKGTQTNINSEIIGITKIPVPPINEQKEISRFLGKKTMEIDFAVQLLETQLSLLDEKRSALITQAVTKGLNPDVKMKDTGIDWLGQIPSHWTFKRMRFLCEITTGGRDTQDAEDEGEFPFFVRSPHIEKISTYSFDGEAVLTSGDGAGVGKIYHHYIGKLDFHQRVYLFSNFNQIKGRLFYHYIKGNLEAVVLSLSAKSTVDSIRLPMLQNFPIAYGSEEEQMEILNHVERVNELTNQLVEKTRRKITLLKEYQTAIISAAVTGKIDVRGL